MVRRFTVVMLVTFCVVVSYSAPLEFGETKGSQAVISGTAVGIGPRALGMGGAYTALAGDSTAMYWNPAGLKHAPSLGFKTNIAGRTSDADVIDDAEELWQAVDDEDWTVGDFKTLRDIADRREGEPVGLSFGANASATALGFGIGAYGEGNSEIKMNYRPPSDDFEDDPEDDSEVENPQIEVNGLATWQYSGGIGHARNLGPGHTVGVVVREATVGFETAEYTATLQNASDGDYIERKDTDFVEHDDSAITVDVGYRTRLHVPLPVLNDIFVGATMKNINEPDLVLRDDAGTTAVPCTLERVLNVGAATTFSEFLVSADLHNVLRANDADTTLHMGAETSILPLVDLRAGLNDGDFVMGVGANLGVVEVDVVTDKGFDEMAGVQIGFDF